VGKIIKNEKGQATIELAIILPIILLFVMLIIYAGIFTFSKSAVLLATHEGGREGLMIKGFTIYTQEQKEEKMKEAINKMVATLPNGANTDIVIHDDNAGIFTIDVTYYFKLNLPFLEQITGYNTIPMHSSVMYRYIQPLTSGGG
jgi:Flp pilus assembly protein TadG